MTRVIVHDASILIDLISIDLLEETLQLPYKMEITDFVVDEITQSIQKTSVEEVVRRGILDVIHSDSGVIDELGHMMSSHPRLSLADCSVLYWARNHSAVLLSGDATLCRVARQESLEAHGTLWVLSSLVSERGAEPSHMAAKLKALMLLNPRLPKNECLSYIRQWTTNDNQ